MHITPLSAGGTDGPENLVAACPSCNALSFYQNLTGDDLRRTAAGGFKLETETVEAFRNAGFAVVSGITGPDAGIDILASRSIPGTGKSIAILIECKWRLEMLWAEDIGRFTQKIRDYKATTGIIVTSAPTTPAAAELAEQRGVSVVAQSGLPELLRTLLEGGVRER
jgi:predicted Mrr-cat superfamily restriction endonuclease